MHKKNFRAVGAMAPTPLSLKTWGGGGGLGGVAYKDRTRPPPVIVIKLFAMRQAAHLAVLLCHYGCLADKLAQSCHWRVHAIGVFRQSVEHAFCANCMPLAFSSHSIYLGSENRGLRL